MPKNYKHSPLQNKRKTKPTRQGRNTNKSNTTAHSIDKDCAADIATTTSNTTKHIIPYDNKISKTNMAINIMQDALDMGLQPIGELQETIEDIVAAL